MRKINRCFIDDAFGPLVGAADNDELDEFLENFNADDSDQVMELMKNLIKPEFDNMLGSIQEKTKMALSYSLTAEEFDFMSVFARNLIPFKPKHPKKFFTIMWNAFFGDEDYQLKDFDDYELINDPNEPIQIIMDSRKNR